MSLFTLPLSALLFLRFPMAPTSENITENAWTDCAGAGGKNATGAVPGGANPAAIFSVPVVGVDGNGIPPPTTNWVFIGYISGVSLKVLLVLIKVFVKVKEFVPVPGCGTPWGACGTPCGTVDGWIGAGGAPPATMAPIPTVPTAVVTTSSISITEAEIRVGCIATNIHW